METYSFFFTKQHYPLKIRIVLQLKCFLRVS